MVGRDGITKYACMIFLDGASWIKRSDRGLESGYIVFFGWNPYFGCDLGDCVL